MQHIPQTEAGLIEYAALIQHPTNPKVARRSSRDFFRWQPGEPATRQRCRIYFRLLGPLQTLAHCRQDKGALSKTPF